MMMFKVIIRDSEGSVLNSYRDSADSKDEMLDKAYNEWGSDVWVEVIEE